MRGHHHHHRSGLRGPEGPGRRGFPNREQWLERLLARRQELEQELANVAELIERLSNSDQPAPAQAPAQA